MRSRWLTCGMASAILVVALTLPADAVIIHVPADQPTIRAGIDDDAYGDTVLVACGIYNEHSIVMKSGVCLRSATGQADCVTIGEQAGRPRVSLHRAALRVAHAAGAACSLVAGLISSPPSCHRSSRPRIPLPITEVSWLASCLTSALPVCPACFSSASDSSAYLSCRLCLPLHTSFLVQ